MKFVLEIELGNDAMQTMHDIAESTRQVAHLMLLASERRPSTNDRGIIRDTNGNTVGKWEVVDETACAVCGVPAPQHGHWLKGDVNIHQWRAK